MEVLDAEKFQTVKELAALGTQVAQTHAALQQLKKDTEGYLQEREAMVAERVKFALESAQSLLTETGKYHETFKVFLNSTGDIRENLVGMVASLSALRAETETYKETFDRYVKEKTAELNEREFHIKTQRATLDSEIKYCATQKDIIRIEKAKIDDERGTLKRALERLKQGKI